MFSDELKNISWEETTERIARDCHGRWLDTHLMERRAAADEPEGFKKL